MGTLPLELLAGAALVAVAFPWSLPHLENGTVLFLPCYILC